MGKLKRGEIRAFSLGHRVGHSMTSRPRKSAVNTNVEPDCETVRFSTPDLLIGEFRCGSDHARFTEAGQIRNCVIAFPRQAVWIHREDAPPFVADGSIATVYSPGVAYERHRLSSAGGNADWFGLSETLAREIVRDIAPALADGAHALPLMRAPVPTALYHAQRRLIESLHRPGFDAIAVEEQAIAIASAILGGALAKGGREVAPSLTSPPSPFQAVSRSPKRSPAARKRTLVEHAKALILLRLDANTSVSDLAAALGCSTFHLCRTFRALTGFTLHSYRRELRLRHALELVPRHRGRLSALALELGFHSHAHFTAAYRAAFGAAPTDRGPRNENEVRAMA
jgi:AraC-like DNA-binding protein